MLTQSNITIAKEKNILQLSKSNFSFNDYIKLLTPNVNYLTYRTANL